MTKIYKATYIYNFVKERNNPPHSKQSYGERYKHDRVDKYENPFPIPRFHA